MSTAVPATHAEHHDPIGSRLGMWLFLFTELVLFGGVFLLYAVYRSKFTADFHYAATTLDPLIGGLNTLILLTSSLTMVLSIGTLERGDRSASMRWLAVTILCGLAFMVIKAFEWSAKIGHGIFPGSEKLIDHTAGENLFYGLYFGMTGLHALHVLVGIGVLAVMLRLVARHREDAGEQAGRLENAGLYWHLVDVIWIFLFPLLYLIT